MTIYSVGYDGSIGAVDWSRYLAPHLGLSGSVADVGDFQVTPSTGMAVRVSPGTAHGWGVTDVSNAAESITIPGVTSSTQTRWDCIVLRRNWSDESVTPTGEKTGGRTTLAVVAGSASKAIPTLDVRPGYVTEQPLALVQVSGASSTVGAVEDLRTTLGKAGYVRSMLAMTGPVGTRYVLESEAGRRYVMAATNGVVKAVPEWEPTPPPPPVIPRVASGTAALDFNDTGVANLYHNLGYRAKTVLVGCRLAGASSLIDLTLSIQPGSINEKYFCINAKVVTDAGWKPYNGNLTWVDWIAIG